MGGAPRLGFHGDLGDIGVVEKWPSALHSCITRDPLIISGPGVPTAGAVEEMVELIDVFPLLDLAGIEPGYAHTSAAACCRSCAIL